MIPKKGKVFPGGNDRENGTTDYATLIARALRAELGDTHQATKILIRWTGASERTVKHWLSGHHGPNGNYLIVLMRESEAVFKAVLSASGRRDAVVAARMLAAHAAMAEVKAMVEREASDIEYAGLPGTDPYRDRTDTGSGDPKSDRKSDRINDPINLAAGHGPNLRQRWCLEALAAGKQIRAGDLQRRWGVCEKTARRDLTTLKQRGMIEFVGSLRTGKYRLCR